MFTNVIEMSFFELTGLIGVALYLGSYAALQFDLLKCTGFAYSFSNFMASSCVLVSLFESFNLSSAIIQIAWIAISVFGILRLLNRKTEESDVAHTPTTTA